MFIILPKISSTLSKYCKLYLIRNVYLQNSYRNISTPIRSDVEYKQGQSPGPNLREYFYYIDHQGMLFLDDARMKNFTSCFKDKKFLNFFYRRLRRNEGSSAGASEAGGKASNNKITTTISRYAPHFPYVSLCGQERNYVRCDDLPVVFTQLLQSPESQKYELRYNHGDEKMSCEFLADSVCMEPATGRVYHPAPPKLAGVAGVALMHTKLALALSAKFRFHNGEEEAPTHILWEGEEIQLTYDLLPKLADLAPLRKYSLGIHDLES